MSSGVCNNTPMDSNEEIVISGIAGRFPESNNMMELKENLMNKVDMITDDERRWKHDDPEIPKRSGKVNNIDKFDSVFFGIHSKQANTMDPMSRMLMEHAYEAVMDAGVNPSELKGSRTGVFIGSTITETEKVLLFEKNQVNGKSGFGVIGASRAMLANRLSYNLGLTGPSYSIDSACNSSIVAMEHAFHAIRRGQCEAALVGGVNLCLNPHLSLQFSRLGVLSADGRCKTFDEAANGYARSETISIIYLQKSNVAKRIYASIVHVKSNCDGYKEQGITFPSTHMQSQLLREFYNECKVSPKLIKYVEAHGTGTKAGDPQEVNAIDSVFTSDRTEPLKIGSVKSNLGHAEPASGMCAIAKVIIAIETGTIPPNLNFKNPRKEIKAFADGRIKVVTEPEHWGGGYIAINSLGFGGTNSHLLLKSNEKIKKNPGKPVDNLPRLVLISGRTNEGVQSFLTNVENSPVDVEYIKLLHDVYTKDFRDHVYRGYTILDSGTSMELGDNISEIEAHDGTKRPIWFIFSGMGSQWPAMGEALLNFPIFADAIRKCDSILKPKNIDIYEILKKPDESITKNIVNSFVGIAAVQIGLVDLLKSLNIVPDHMIGHSAGELGCAYADGCFTADQVILAAYSRGLAVTESKMISGAMTAVGLGYNNIKDMCPPDIQVACHNSADNSTISGPADSMKVFVAKLTAENIFARDVPCNDIAYHSRYIAEAGPKMLNSLKKIIPEPKARSSKWLSTSVPQEQWSTPAAKFSSAEYHTNNLLSPVLFEEVTRLIPQDAVTIEIAPHGLLQAILRRSLNPTVKNISLMKKGHINNDKFFLQAIGKLFNTGYQPEIAKLYPEVKFPVSKGTPMISPHIKWEHSDSWFVASFNLQEDIVSGQRKVEVGLRDENFKYMAGHIIDGRNLFPASGYLELVWETFGMMRGELYTEVSVVFQDIKFLRATNLPKEGTVELTLKIQEETGRFEVIEGEMIVVTGYIHHLSESSAEKMISLEQLVEETDDELTNHDIYQQFKLRGYDYSGIFRGIKTCTLERTQGKVVWNRNWVTFLDNVMQMKTLSMDTKSLFIPTGIQKLTINTKDHENRINAESSDEKLFQVVYNKHLDVIVSSGVEIEGLKRTAINRRKMTNLPVLESYKFVPNQSDEQISFYEALRIATHLVIENNVGVSFNVLEFIDSNESITTDNLISSDILEIVNQIPLIRIDGKIVAETNCFQGQTLPSQINFTELNKLSSERNDSFLIGKDLLSFEKNSLLTQLLASVEDTGFILTVEGNENTSSKDNLEKLRLDHHLNVVLKKVVGDSTVILLRQVFKYPAISAIIQVKNDTFSWINILKDAMKTEMEKKSGDRSRILLISEKSFEGGFMGLMTCLRREKGGELLRGFVLQDPDAPDFDQLKSFYSEQLDLDLVINVLRKNTKSSEPLWGTYRHLELSKSVLENKAHGRASQIVRGDLSSLKWLEGPISSNLSGSDLVKIVYSAVNHRDTALAIGKLATEVIAKNRIDEECMLGFEYAGVDQINERVMGLIKSGAITNLAIIDRDLCWKVPKDWTLEQAATVPSAYATAYYALYMNCKMKRNDKILIHSGIESVSQAAITLALSKGCEIFTTVETADERKYIREKYPQISDDHIGSSKDISFQLMILECTKGEGVDIILNSLFDQEKLDASIRCLAKGGTILDMISYAMKNEFHVKTFGSFKVINYQGILLDDLLNGGEDKKLELKGLMQEGLDGGIVKPLMSKLFEKDELNDAFQHTMSDKSKKVLIKVLDETNLQNIAIPAYPHFYCLPDRSYLILGGLGGFGLELADWLVLRGAKNLILTSRSGIKTGYQKMRLKVWQSYGIKVSIIMGKEAHKRQDCLDIINECNSIAPIDALFNLAAVLKDSPWENQTPELFEESFKAKPWSTKNLDELTRELCPGLRYFVVFSSVSSGLGNAEQTNYGMANSAMERICEKRNFENLHGLAIQWGPIGDVGMVANIQESYKKEIVIRGTLQQRISSCLYELDGFLSQSQPIVSSMIVAEKLVSSDESASSKTANVINSVLNTMGYKDLKSVIQHKPFSDLGMDSMMSVEIKQTIEREFRIFLTSRDIRALTFAKLINMSPNNDNKSSQQLMEITDLKRLNESVVSVGSGKFIFQPKMKQEISGIYNFKPRSNDVFVMSLPRSGTTLTEEIVWLLSNDLDFANAQEIPLEQRAIEMEVSTFPDRWQDLKMAIRTNDNPKSYKSVVCDFSKPAYEEYEKIPGGRVIKTHVPMSLYQNILTSKAKIIYVARNPKDRIVSMWRFINAGDRSVYQCSFEEYWKEVKNNLEYAGPSWPHMQEAWAQREHPNVYFVFYEDLMKNMEKKIKEISVFLGKNYTDDEIAKVVNHVNIDNFRKNSKVYNLHGLPAVASVFIGQGKVGGYKDIISPEIDREIDEWIEKNQSGSDKIIFPNY